MTNISVKFVSKVFIAFVLLSINTISFAALQELINSGFYVPGSSKLIESKFADLNGDGKEDVIFVTENLNENKNATEIERESFVKGQRTATILIRGDDGKLIKAVENKYVYFCRKCLGSSSSSEQNISITRLGFNILNKGGSPRYRWDRKYSFSYDTKTTSWLLKKVETSVMDTTNASKFISKKFHPRKKIDFSSFTADPRWDAKF